MGGRVSVCTLTRGPVVWHHTTPHVIVHPRRVHVIVHPRRVHVIFHPCRVHVKVSAVKVLSETCVDGCVSCENMQVIFARGFWQ